MNGSRAGNPGGPRSLVWILRAGSVLLISAFFGVLLPTETMVGIHAWLGLGELPRAPIVDYLARSASALYGFHGILLLLVSTDVERFRPIVVYLGWMNVTFGLIVTGIDLAAPLPLWWTLSEGPPLIVIGAALLTLVRRVPRR